MLLHVLGFTVGLRKVDVSNAGAIFFFGFKVFRVQGLGL